MEVHFLGWLFLATVILVLIVVDIYGHVRRPHEPSIKEAALWSLAYVLLAVAFGGAIWLIYGHTYASEYFAGWITEKALSIDNLFVFVIIMGTFRVPRMFQQKALLFGVVIALVLRLVFILLGAAIIERFAWVFYFFGLWLLWTAYSQATAKPNKESEQYEESRIVRWMRKVLPVSKDFVGQKLFARVDGKLVLTPLLLCVFALGLADLMFAFDSIPAIFGLTQQPYLVFAANAFSLLGLRQLYFLIDGLLSRLVYLHYGLAVILGFIGVKLILHALAENSVPFINSGRPLAVPEIGTGTSLIVILGVITVTVLASIISNGIRRKETMDDKFSNSR